MEGVFKGFSQKTIAFIINLKNHNTKKWFNTPLTALSGEKPVAFFDTFEGREWVSQILREITHS